MFIATVTNVQVINDVGFTNQYVTPLLPYFEIFYCLCTLGLLVVAIIGLRQFVLTKRIAKANSRRDALKVSADQCKNYADNILPLVTILSSKTRELKLKKAFSVSVDKSRICVKKISPITKSDFDAFMEVADDFAKLFNAIESFSQYLTSGLADENNAYLCLGDLHLSVVSPYIPILVEQAQDGHMWCNTLRIYVIWYCRKQKDIVERTKKIFAEREKQLESQKSKYDDNGIAILDIDSICK